MPVVGWVFVLVLRLECSIKFVDFNFLIAKLCLSVCISREVLLSFNQVAKRGGSAKCYGAFSVEYVPYFIAYEE